MLGGAGPRLQWARQRSPRSMGFIAMHPEALQSRVSLPDDLVSPQSIDVTKVKPIKLLALCFPSDVAVS